MTLGVSIEPAPPLLPSIVRGDLAGSQGERSTRGVHGRALREQRRLSSLFSPYCTRRTSIASFFSSPTEEWPGCPLLRASDEYCFIVRVLRARRAPGRSSFIPPSCSRASFQGWAGRFSNARVERVRFYNAPSKLARCAFLEGHPCWSTCGRRTRPFLGRAFREHRTNVGVLPPFYC